MLQNASPQLTTDYVQSSHCGTRTTSRQSAESGTCKLGRARLLADLSIGNRLVSSLVSVAELMTVAAMFVK